MMCHQGPMLWKLSHQHTNLIQSASILHPKEKWGIQRCMVETSEFGANVWYMYAAIHCALRWYQLIVKPSFILQRARLVNHIKTSEVIRMPYPLQIRSPGPNIYFTKRETWGWTDFLMNPMVNILWSLISLLSKKVIIGSCIVCDMVGLSHLP